MVFDEERKMYMKAVTDSLSECSCNTAISIRYVRSRAIFLGIEGGKAQEEKRRPRYGESSFKLNQNSVTCSIIQRRTTSGCVEKFCWCHSTRRKHLSGMQYASDVSVDSSEALENVSDVVWAGTKERETNQVNVNWSQV